MKDFLLPYDPAITKINNLVMKLKGKKLGAKLRSSGCRLAPQQMNITRWSSTFNMLKRYTQIKAYHGNFTTETSILNFLLNSREENDFGFLLKVLGKCEPVTKTLQSESIDLADIQLLFDGVLEMLPYIDTSKKQLAKIATIIKYEEFETGVVKILSGRERALTEGE